MKGVFHTLDKEKDTRSQDFLSSNCEDKGQTDEHSTSSSERSANTGLLSNHKNQNHDDEDYEGQNIVQGPDGVILESGVIGEIKLAKNRTQVLTTSCMLLATSRRSL
jgi:hypothetical protein